MKYDIGQDFQGKAALMNATLHDPAIRTSGKEPMRTNVTIQSEVFKVTLNKYVKIFCHRPKNQAFYSSVHLFNSIVVNLIKYC
jgi:predicted nucleic-acid-binding Zn-ribbon protein